MIGPKPNERNRDLRSTSGGRDRAAPKAHGRPVAPRGRSLYLFSETNRARVACVKTVTHPWFDRFILLLILLNSIVLAITDWTVIDEDPTSDSVGEPLAEGSWRNALLYDTEVVFTALFALEFVLKVIAHGFILGQGAYLRDAWNVLDFLVVVTALLTSIPGMPTASAIRVLRVLRPLRSVSALPSLQHLVVSMLKSVPQLVSVVILLLFIFVVFGIFGIQMFAGKQHSRCRLTPYPVTLGFEAGMNYTGYRCLDTSNFDTTDDEGTSSWTQSSSPWATAQECWWPLDVEDTRLCAFDSSPGNHKCDHDAASTASESDFRWCGSDYDALGNRRFTGGVIEGVEWSAAELTANATFVEDLAWGYTTFDNMFAAFLSIFQSITLEGWSDILYQVKDCTLPILADLFFIVLVLWGAFFTINLLLAVLETNFSQGKDEEAAEAAALQQRQQQQEQQEQQEQEQQEQQRQQEQQEQQQKQQQQQRRRRSRSDILGAAAEEKAVAAQRLAQETKSEVAVAPPATAAATDGGGVGGNAEAEAGIDASFAGMEVGSKPGKTRAGTTDVDELAAGGREGRGGRSEASERSSSGSFSSGIVEGNGSSGSGSGGSKHEGCWARWRSALRRFACSDAFQRSIMALIVLNTLILALDHHPLDDDFSTVLDVFNLAFTMCFTLEMAVKLLALGPREYAKDKFNLFDGLIVISSLLELILSPPDIFTGGSGGDSGGGLSALRSFRVFRVFKLARGWDSMRDLLETLRKTLLDIGNFGLLLLLLMFIYSLIGLQFFANRFHFGDDGRAIGIGEEGYHDAHIPRSNFDTLVNALVTIFEVLSGENWNATMYSARRAVGWASTIYFASLIILGMMIMMSLFLAILLSNFSSPAHEDAGDEGQEKEEEEEEEEEEGEEWSTVRKERSEQQQQREEYLKPEGSVETGQTKHQKEQDSVGDMMESRQQVEEGDTGGMDGISGGEMNISNTSQLEEGPFRGARLPSDHKGDLASPTVAAEDALLRAQRVALSGRWVEGAEKSLDGASDGASGSDNGNRSRSGSDTEMRLTPGHRDHLHHQARLRRARSTQEAPAHASDAVNHDSSTEQERKADADEGRGSAVGARVARYWFRAVRSVKVPDDLYPGLALCCLSAKNPLRRVCAALVTNAGFHRFITFLIVVSSITLALDNPLRDPDSATTNVLHIIEVVTAIFFTLEFVLKICATGFYFMPMAYLKDAWNVLDFFVVVVVLVDFAAIGPSLVGLRSLRALRALRPLRIIKRLPGLKLVLEALIGSMPGVVNVAAVCFLFYIIFAILCVNYFKGVLMSCQGEGFDALPDAVASFLESPLSWSEMSAEQQGWFGPLSNVSEPFSENFVDDSGNFSSSAAEEYCVETSGGLWPESGGCCIDWPSSAGEAPTSLEVCECLGLQWGETIPQQFNHVGVALLTLFEISTTEAWTAVTYAAVDSTEVDMQPIRDNVVSRVWFFILFMLVGAYLVVNLFVGVVVDNFKKMKTHAEGGGSLVTDHQRSWTKTRLILSRLKPMKQPRPPADPVGAWCFHLIRRSWFDPAVMVCILLNTLVMAMVYFGQSYLYTRVLEGLNVTFFFLFATEALIKIIALKRVYFKDPWNRFDFFIVLGSAAGLVSLIVSGSSYGSIATIIRTFRIGRVLRLVRGLESMAQLFSTLLMTLPSLGNVGALLFLLFFIYAAMGLQLYAKVGYEGAVTAQANFRSFWDTMVLLLRFSTGENWNGFMYDMAADREGCESDPEYDPDVCGFFDSNADCSTELNGCGTNTIFPYMISFTFTITFVFLNLFIGVILDGFDSAQEENSEYIKEEDFKEFAERWAVYDPHATCLISVQDLHRFLQTLFKPWGFGVDYQATSRELRHKVRRLHIHVYDGNQVHFKDVLHALSKEVYRSEAEKKGEPLDLKDDEEANRDKQSFKIKKLANITDSWRKVKGKSKRGLGDSSSHHSSSVNHTKRAVYMMHPLSKRNVTLEEIMAAEFLQQAFRNRREQRRKERAEAEAAASRECPAIPPLQVRGDSWISSFAGTSLPPSPSPSPSPLPRLLSSRSSRRSPVGVSSSSSRSNGRSSDPDKFNSSTQRSSTADDVAFKPAFAGDAAGERAGQAHVHHLGNKVGISNGSSGGTLPSRTAAVLTPRAVVDEEKREEKAKEGGEARGSASMEGAGEEREARKEKERGRESFSAAGRTAGAAVEGQARAAPRADAEVVADKSHKPPSGMAAANDNDSDNDDSSANGGAGGNAEARARNGLRQQWIGRSLLLSPSGATSSEGQPSLDSGASPRMWTTSAHPAAVSFPPPPPPLVRRWSVDSGGRRKGRGGEGMQRKNRPVMISFSASSDGENDTDDGRSSVVERKAIP